MEYIFESESELTVVTQAGSIAKAREAIKGAEEIDIALMDLGLPDGDGREIQ